MAYHLHLDFEKKSIFIPSKLGQLKRQSKAFFFLYQRTLAQRIKKF